MTTAEALAPLSINTWVRMTRPGFLAITVVACILGISTAAACGHPIQWEMAAATLLLAVLMHASANVLNDYHDALNGADDANQHGLFPFTGGARMIQTGEVSLTDTRDLVLALLLVVIPAGMWLAVQTGGGLVVLGLAGLMLGWAYSAPPLAVKLLLEAGADPTLVNHGNASALDLALTAEREQSAFYFWAIALLSLLLGVLVACVSPHLDKELAGSGIGSSAGAPPRSRGGRGRAGRRVVVAGRASRCGCRGCRRSWRATRR